MRKLIAFLLTAALLASYGGAALAFSQGEAKTQWIEAQQTRLAAEAAYRQAQLDYQKDKTPENDQKVVEAAKTVLGDALDEAEAWLQWKRLEAQEDSRVPADIKSNIEDDVAKNLDKIADLRSDVAGIQNRLQAVAVFIKIAGGYVELLTDVARNTGAMWSYVGETLAASAADFEVKLRASALDMEDNADLLAKLDAAKAEIETAQNKISIAKEAYASVRLPGAPLVKFAEGNEYLRQARTNLLNAQSQLANVFRLITSK